MVERHQYRYRSFSSRRRCSLNRRRSRVSLERFPICTTPTPGTQTASNNSPPPGPKGRTCPGGFPGGGGWLQVELHKRVKCLAQEHNAVPQSGLEPRPLDPESIAVIIRPPHLHCILMYQLLKPWREKKNY